MKFGLALGALNPARWVDVTVEADRAGFESVWLPEHLVLPVAMTGSPYTGSEHPPLPPATPVFDVFAYAGYLAGRTTRIRLGTYVYNVGLRHPFVSARAAATLDILTGGRFQFGVGAGWLAAEWEAAEVDFATRGARIDETLDICHRLWTEPEVAHEGRFFRFGPVAFEPKPSTPGGPPLHFGGDGPAAIRRAATIGAGWMPMNHRAADLPVALDRLGRLAAGAGRARPEVTLAASVASPAEVDELETLGVDRLIVRPWRRSSEAVDSLADFRAAMGPHFAGDDIS